MKQPDPALVRSIRQVLDKAEPARWPNPAPHSERVSGEDDQRSPSNFDREQMRSARYQRHVLGAGALVVSATFVAVFAQHVPSEQYRTAVAITAAVVFMVGVAIFIASPKGAIPLEHGGRRKQRRRPSRSLESAWR